MWGFTSGDIKRDCNLAIYAEYVLIVLYITVNRTKENDTTLYCEYKIHCALVIGQVKN